jgi:copper chaperone CopZ
MTWMTSFTLSSLLWLSPPSLNSSPTSVVIDIRGMVCAFCATSLEDKFKEVKGVQKVFVDFKTRVVIVSFDGEVTLSDPEINRLILDAGYSQRQIIRSEESLEALQKKYAQGFKNP